MSVYWKSRALALFAAAIVIGVQSIATNAFAGKPMFERTKPHTNVSTLAQIKRMKSEGGQAMSAHRKEQILLQQISQPASSKTELLIFVTPQITR
jgi:hypothetical protein